LSAGGEQSVGGGRGVCQEWRNEKEKASSSADASGKAPSTKLQAPEKLQAPTPKAGSGATRAVWRMRLDSVIESGGAAVEQWASSPRPSPPEEERENSRPGP